MRLLSSLLLVILSLPCLAKPIEITDIHLWEQTQRSIRLVFDVTGPVTHNIFTLSAPHRLVIDFKNALLKKHLSTLSEEHAFLKNIRSAARNEHDLRVVFDLKLPVRSKSFLLRPSGNEGHRLVIDLDSSKGSTNRLFPFQTKQHSKQPITPSLQPTTHAVAPVPKPSPVTHTRYGRDVIIAIDAGHGGIDPGAVGQQGTTEKEVVLAIAQELARLLNQERGMHPVLIRSGDYFLKLRRRIELAREYQADLFISIHADAYPEEETASGASVYMLSHSGASSEAAHWLAEKENAADLLGGVSLSDKDKLLASVLLDLSQTSTLAASAHAANALLKALSKGIGRNHQSRVQRAGFVVLRSPDIPSILIETTFISNPKEEQKLNNSRYRYQVAKAILEGIRHYFEEHAPVDTLLARR